MHLVVRCVAAALTPAIDDLRGEHPVALQRHYRSLDRSGGGWPDADRLRGDVRVDVAVVDLERDRPRGLGRAARRLDLDRLQRSLVLGNGRRAVEREDA